MEFRRLSVEYAKPVDEGLSPARRSGASGLKSQHASFKQWVERWVEQVTT